VRSVALSFGRSPAVAMIGGVAALRRRGSRWRLRDWRLRTKLTAVLVVPLVLAGVLGILRVSELTGKAQDFAALTRQVGFAQQLGSVVYDLQRERYRVATLLATGHTADPAALQAQTQQVDSAVAMLRAADVDADAFPAAAGSQWVTVHREVLRRLRGLAALRQAILAPNPAPGIVTARDAITTYSGLIEALLVLDRRALYGAPGFLSAQADGAQELATATERASWQHVVLLTGIFSGGLTPEQLVMLRTTEVQFDAAAAEFGQALSPAQQQRYFNATAVIDRKRLLDAALDRAARGAPLETASGDWDSAAAGTVEVIRQGQVGLLDELRKDTATRSDQAGREALRDGAVVLAILLLAVALLIIVVRSLLQPLRALRTAAFEVADRRLPEAVEQVQATRATDGAVGPATVDPVPVHSKEEVGQVARAVDTVHEQAVRLATEQAQLRCSLNDIFLNLSGRSQCLAERQAQLIEEIRRAAPPGSELVDTVAQLDRVAAQMRRHRENLLVLAGGTAHFGDQPVAVSDVLANAVSVIAEHQRVTVSPAPAAVVASPVVNDLVHLVAELLDNAISVTPPGTMVILGASLTENNGLQVAVTDSGPGLSPSELLVINGRLGSVPAVDASVSGQAGLFVVRELAARQSIKVRLRERLGDQGLIATAVLPPSLVTITLRAPLASPLPLQVSVIDEATPADLFSPTSISPAAVGAGSSPRNPARTAQEEWLELFGHHEPEHAAAADQLGGGQMPAGSATAALAEPQSAGHPQQIREEIYEMVSAWFREQQAAPPSTTTPEWRSPLDAGWQAAQALRAPVNHELTQAGLPKRQPRAHLVSGADGRLVPTPLPVGPHRTPDVVRGRLSRYQRGLRVGRHARISADELPTFTDIAQPPFERRFFEENPQ
jgi:signal transduction histidine kinase